MNSTTNNTVTETETSGGIMLDTPEQICAYRELMIYNGLKFEIKTAARGIPMRLTRGVSCYALAKKEYGLKGNREKVLAGLKEILEAKYGVTLG
jgi:hypothetical protein